MAKASAFAGMKLSEQVAAPPSSLDQRLFSIRPANGPSQQNGRVREPATQETSKLATQEAGRDDGQTGSQEASRKAAQEAGSERVKQDGGPGRKPFDLNEPAHRKATFMLTDREFEALEDLKLSLRRAHDRDVPKNDLIRLAVHLLLEEYEHKQDSSLVLRRFAGRARR